MVNWFVYAVVSAIFFGALTVLFKLTLNKGLNMESLLAYSFTAMAILFWGYVLFTQKFAVPTQEVGVLILIIGAVTAVANIALFAAYSSISNPSYPSAVQNSLAIVVAFLLSVVAFNLRPDLIGVSGVVLIISGVAILSRVV